MDTESLEEWWPGAGAGGHGELLCRDDSFRFLKERATELLHDNVHVVIIDRASLVDQLVKIPPAIRETWVPSLA